MSYSQDLWKEFGSSDQDLLQNPWDNVTNQKATFENGLEGDDFGDFESADAQTVEAHLPASINDPWQKMSFFHHPVGAFAQESFLASPSKPSTGLIEPSSTAVSKTKLQQSSPIRLATPHLGKKETLSKQLVLSTANKDEEWGEFVDDSTPLEPTSNSARGDGLSMRSLETFHPPNFVATVSLVPNPPQAPKGKPAVASVEGPPPSNVPPPSILLLLIVEIFQTLLHDVKSIITPASSSKEPNAQLGNEQVSKVNCRLAIARTSARIIAGRKLRWRRDNRLSQGMKIGPANSGKSGGMKLAGIDKMENRREDGEVVEAVRTWKQHMGSLRAAIAAANSRQPGLNLAVPEIAENLPVRTAKASEGALVAPKSCFLCGLRRDERIEKVDRKVEDSFGEWWVEHWGHTDCKIFWEEKKGSLHQR